MPKSLALKPNSVALKLAAQESRLKGALDKMKQGSVEARLALYMIRADELYKAVVDERGEPVFNSFKQYVADRWQHILSPNTALYWTSTLMRLASMGLAAEVVAREVPPTVAHRLTLAAGKWDYTTQTLLTPNESLVADAPGGDLAQGMRKLYDEAKELAKDHGAGEAVALIRQRAGEPAFAVYRTSQDDQPLLLKITVTRYESNEPRLSTEEFWLTGDRPFPQALIRWLRSRLWFKQAGYNGREEKLK